MFNRALNVSLIFSVWICLVVRTVHVGVYEFWPCFLSSCWFTYCTFMERNLSLLLHHVFFLVIFLAAASRGRYWKMLSEISETWECFYDLKGFCLNEPFIVEFGVLALDFFVQVWIFMLHALIALLEKCAYLWICTTNTNKQRFQIA